MMLGGGLMMGIGLLMMLAIIGIPVLIIAAIVGGTGSFLNRLTPAPAVYHQSVTTTSNPVIQPDKSVSVTSGLCTHCDAGLQPGWTHCPRCGASIS